MTMVDVRWPIEAVRRTLRSTYKALNALITLTVRTHKWRWARVAQEEPPWDDRNRVIASFIPENSAVVDLGSGARTLKRYLKPGCEYQPCDVVQSAPEVLLCDFNAGHYPALTRKYDYVICSGILEYIRDPGTVLPRIAAFGDKLLLSYNPLLEGQKKFYRLSNNWVNHFEVAQLESLFDAAGLTYRLLHAGPTHERLYELIRR